MLAEYCREFNYMANCANLDFDIQTNYDVINLNWSGFNDTLFNYVNESLNKLN